MKFLNKLAIGIGAVLISSCLTTFANFKGNDLCAKTQRKEKAECLQLYNKTTELAKAKKFNEAIMLWTKFLNKYPKSWAANIALAGLYSEQTQSNQLSTQNFQKIKAYLEEALKIDPEHPKSYGIYEGLGQTYHQYAQTLKDKEQPSKQQSSPKPSARVPVPCEAQKEVPLDQANMSDIDIQVSANTAAVTVFTYDFVNYTKQLNTASKFFTKTGWQNFVKALEASKTLDTVKAKRLLVSSVATGAPLILRKGLIQKGQFGWEVRLPLLVTLQGMESQQQYHYLVTMFIKRVPTAENARGIAIDSFIATIRE